MTLTLRELATFVGGQLHGDGDRPISGAAIIRDAAEGEITLADRPKFAPDLAASDASAAVVAEVLPQVDLPQIVVDDVHAAFAKIVSRFRPAPARRHCGISPAAHISSSAKLGARVEVHPGAVIEDDVEIGDGVVIHSNVCIMAGSKIGERAIIFPQAVLYENTVVGHDSIIHAGAVIGAYGFGYETKGGRHELSAQLGNVEIGPHVEIGAGATIDRGAYGSTTIGEGTKIDNQVMIAHNCRIGRHNLLCSQVGVAGSTTTGDYVVMAGQVGVRDHVHIGEGSRLGAQAGVMADIPPGVAYVGSPATPEREQMVMQAAFAKLPEMRKALKALQRKVDQLSDDSSQAVRRPHAA